MSNIGSTLAKVVVFVGGVFAGIMLTEWIDKLLATQVQEQSEHDGNHYAQGLRPYSQPPSNEDDQVKQ
jgi:hypothetical protein